jgi:hypothetical protein
MKYLLTWFLSLTIANSTCYAQNVVHVAKGQACPFTGTLLTDKQAALIAKELTDCDKVKLINQDLQKEVGFYQQNETIYLKEISEVRAQNTSLDTALTKANQNNFWRNALWFGLGFVVSGLTVYTVEKNK